MQTQKKQKAEERKSNQAGKTYTHNVRGYWLKRIKYLLTLQLMTKALTKRVAVNAKKLGLELDKAGAGADRVAQRSRQSQ